MIAPPDRLILSPARNSGVVSCVTTWVLPSSMCSVTRYTRSEPPPLLPVRPPRRAAPVEPVPGPVAEIPPLPPLLLVLPLAIPLPPAPPPLVAPPLALPPLAPPLAPLLLVSPLPLPPLPPLPLSEPCMELHADSPNAAASRPASSTLWCL